MNPDEIRARIDHYCILPPDDPHRRELMRHVATAPEDVRAYYLSVLAEQEKLRLAIASQSAQEPLGLSTRLLAIPDDKYTNPWPLVRRILFASVAAAFILAVLASVQFWTAARRQASLESLAWQSLSLRINRPVITPGAITQMALQKAVPGMPFSAELYNYGGYKLTGYGAVTIAGQPGVLTQWQRGPTTCTMLQFPLRLIPAGTHASGISIHLMARIPGNSAGRQPYTVTLWPDRRGHCGWAVVLTGSQRYHPFNLNG